jgi:hypothetical protein
MSNSILPTRDTIRQEYQYRVRHIIFELAILIRRVRHKALDSLLPGLHEAKEELEAIYVHDPTTDLKQVDALLSQKLELMSSALEILEGELWKTRAKELQTYLQLKLLGAIKQAFLEGRTDVLVSLVDLSNTIEKLNVDDATIDRSSTMDALMRAQKLIGDIVFKEASYVE